MNEIFGWKEGEKVLVIDGHLYYEARVLKMEVWENRKDGDSGPHCFVHYLGWKNSWDEWVPRARVIDYNDKNLAERKRIKQEETKKKKSKKSSSHQSQNQQVQSHHKVIKKPVKEPLKITVPNILKAKLVEDWGNVSNDNKLLQLPCSPTIYEILEEYENTRIRRSYRDHRTEVSNGLKAYFDQTLDKILLYPSERDQYKDLEKNSSRKPGEIYGAEHLLRLFVKLPELISDINETRMNKEAKDFLIENLGEFLGFLARNKEGFFKGNYINQTKTEIEIDSM